MRQLLTKAFVCLLLATAAIPGQTADSVGGKGEEIGELLAFAQPGATVYLPSGTWSAEPGTTYVITKPVSVIGNGTTLVNIRLVFLADFALANVRFEEQDCTWHSTDPATCAPATPMLTIGLQGHPIRRATVSNVSMQFGRAYTGIAFGLDELENLTIDGFDITDNEMSAITGFGGRKIRIANGTITGGATANVDDGVALYAVYGELSDVLVENVSAHDTFDVVGIGALMYRPIHDVVVKDIQCRHTAVCVYVKAGDQAPVPEPFERYSELSHVRISGVQDNDRDGHRYLATVWVFSKGGAVARDILIDGVKATSRAIADGTARIRIFADETSTISDLTISNAAFRDPKAGAAASSDAAGFPLTAGICLQSFGADRIRRVAFDNVLIDGAAFYAIDSGGAKVEGLSIRNSQFLHMHAAGTKAPLFIIPYSFDLDGHTAWF